MKKNKIEKIIFVSMLFLWTCFVALYYVQCNSYELVTDVVTTNDEKYKFNIDSVSFSTRGRYAYINGWCIKEGVGIATYDTSIVLWDEEENEGYVVPTMMVRRTDVRDKYSDGNDYSNCGFSATIDMSRIDYTKIYTVYICYANNNDFVYINTGQGIGGN